MAKETDKLAIKEPRCRLWRSRRQGGGVADRILCQWLEGETRLDEVAVFCPDAMVSIDHQKSITAFCVVDELVSAPSLPRIQKLFISV